MSISTPKKVPLIRNGGGELLAGGVAAILASACCLGPLVLLTLGLSGAWIAQLTALEPYSPIFIGTALLALLLAARRIWRPAAECTTGSACADPKVARGYKALFVAVAMMLLVAVASPQVAPFFY